jgi:Predicted phosphoribosyltransferases
MTWQDLGVGARELAHRIVDDGYEADMVLSIARGGLLVGAALGYALGIKNTFAMNVEYYTGIDARLEMPMLLPPVPDLVDFAETRVLIADDVADTGATLALVKEFCEGKVAEVRCAVLYEKVEWLDKNDIPYWDLCFVRDKPVVGADLYIEDTSKNIIALREAGRPTIIFTNLGNVTLPGRRVSDWIEVERIVRDEHKRWSTNRDAEAGLLALGRAE